MILFKSHIINTSRASLKEFYDKLQELPEKEYRVFVCDEKQTRTLEQNKFYWGVVLPLIAAEVGLSKDEVHELMKFKHNKTAVYDPETDEVIETARSTTGMKISEFQDYVERVKEWATTFLQVVFPDEANVPDEILIKNQ